MIPGLSVPTDGRLASLVRVPIPYILEMRVRGKIITSISMPNDPDGITVERAGARSIQHTFGDKPIIERGEIKAGAVNIKGVSGYKPRAGYNRQGQVIYQDGPAILREFDRFIDGFYKQAAEIERLAELLPVSVGGINDAPPVELIFRAIDEDTHVKVDVAGWRWARDAVRARIMVDWALSLEVYGSADPVVPLNVLSPVSDLFEAAAAKIDQANAVLAVADNAATNLRADLETLKAPLRAVRRTASALGQISESARELASFPRDLVADYARGAIELRAAYQDAKENLSLLAPLGGLGFVNEFDLIDSTIGFASETVARDALVILGYSGGTGLDLKRAELRSEQDRAGIPLSPQLGSYTLLTGDSLKDVAFRVYGSRSRWTELADLNGWISPYRDSKGRAARVGMTVKIPQAEVDQVVPDSVDPYGHDLWLSDDGKMDWSSGDLRSARGPDNLRQAIRDRVLTIAGEVPLFPEFGLPDFIGQSVDAEMRGLVAAHMREQLLRDQRIQQITSLELVDNGDAVNVEALVTPTQGPPFRLVVPL